MEEDVAVCLRCLSLYAIVIAVNASHPSLPSVVNQGIHSLSIQGIIKIKSKSNQIGFPI